MGDFEILSEITSIEIIAVGSHIRELRHLTEAYGAGRWRKLKGIATIRRRTAECGAPRFTGTKLTGSGRKTSRLSDTSSEMNKHPRFAVCIRNAGYLASLELRKLYQVVDDQAAEDDGMLRVIDESGEGYLFPANMFIMVALPAAAEEAVLQAVETAG